MTKAVAVNLYEQDISSQSLDFLLEKNAFTLIDNLKKYLHENNIDKGYLLVHGDRPEILNQLKTALRQTGLETEAAILTVSGEKSFLLSGERINLRKLIPESGIIWLSPFDLAENANYPLTIKGVIKKPGVYEITRDVTFIDCLYDYGGGFTGHGTKFKALLIGGPLGLFFGSSVLKTSLFRENLSLQGIEGYPGSLMFFDNRSCIVNLNKILLSYSIVELSSCKECQVCSFHLREIYDLLEKFTTKTCSAKDLFNLQELVAKAKSAAQCVTGSNVLRPLKTSLTNFYGEFLQHAEKHYCCASICTDLMLAPCHNSCPANVDLPGTIALIQKGDYKGAVTLGRAANPFFLSCGRVCEDPPCQVNCKRLSIDEALDSPGLHRFAGNKALQWEGNLPSVLKSPVIKRSFSTRKNIAIIGAGPAGLSVAYFLARYGHKPVIYEASSEAGGMMQLGIPEYRLPREILQAEINHILSLGVEIKYNTRLGKNITLREIQKEYDAVFIGVGCQKSGKMNIPGENLEGVTSGVDFLARLHMGKNIPVGKKVAVIGGGNVAVDAARSARRLGAESVIVLYRRALGDMPASPSEIAAAREEGIEIRPMVAPQTIRGNNGQVTSVDLQEMIPGSFDTSGRRNPVPALDKTFTLPVDLVIMAVGQSLRADDFDGQNIVLDKELIKVNPDTFMTNLEGVFSAGDCVSGPATVVAAVGMARKAAGAIHSYLLPGEISQPLTAEWRNEAIGCFTAPYSCAPGKKPVSAHLPLEKRLSSFDEVNLGYSETTAAKELERCICSAKGRC